MDNPNPPARPQPQPPFPPPPPKPDPVNLLQQQLERLKKIEDHLNFIKSAIIIGAILYLLDTIILLFNRFVSALR